MKRAKANEPILPGSQIGILGGGQLARMTALAARSMGYRIVVLDPDPNCAAAPLVDEVIVAAFDDVAAATELARKSDVVTYEIERIAPAVLRAVESMALLRPGAAVLECVQDRMTQKQWLQQAGYPVGPWRSVGTTAEMEEAVREFGRCRVKRTRGGYDGRSQARIASLEDVPVLFTQLGGTCIAEKELDLALELSVLVARSASGETVAHPPAANWHSEGILVYSLLPAPVNSALAQRARDLAISLAQDLQLQGVLVVEMFVTSDGQLLVNELAPRPHNTYHHAGEACATSQFEQYVRAICGLPLGSTEVHGSAVLVNLLGDEFTHRGELVTELLRIPGVAVHLYGKEPRPKRKIGHIAVSGATVSTVQRRADSVMHLLGLDSGLQHHRPQMAFEELSEAS